MDPIDNVSRDTKDGTYRCPQCKTPFTRRSNLRRHFQIHLRGTTSLICEVCNEEHITKDSLQDHVANSHWHSPSWNISHENPLRRFVIPQDITSSHSPFSTPSYGPFSSHTSLNQYPNLVPSPSRAFQVPNFGTLNGSTSSSGSSSLSELSSVLPSSNMTSDTRTPMVGFPPSSNPFSHRRSSTSMSSISSEPSSSHYTRIGQQPGTQQGHPYYGLYPNPSSEAPSSSAYQEWIAKIMEQQQQGFNHDHGASDDWPIYTRRDVRNMLDVVTDSFIESVERILNANAALDTGVRQMILNEVIPRLVSRLEGNHHEDHVNSHADGG